MDDTSNKNGLDVSSQIAELQQRFSDQLPTRLAVIQQGFSGFVSQAGNKEEFATLCRNLHNLAGSAGSFGAANVSFAARDMEKSLYDEGPNSRHQSEAMLARLETAIKHWLEGKVDSLEQLYQPRFTENFNSLIYLVEDDNDLALQIIGILSRIGYQVEHFSNLQAFISHCAQVSAPGAIIMDMIFDDYEQTGADAIQQVRQLLKSMPPVVFITVRDDIHSRLAAVRAGARRYLTKPLDFNKLCQTLDGLTGRLLTSSYRILLVDDDRDLLDYHASLLGAAGFDAKAMDQPMQVLQAMENFQPDLVLLDIYMPECSGLELAAMIRQDDRWANIPVVFLSSEADIEKKLGALDLGGDDFITKPVDPQNFINALKPRLGRARLMKRLNQDLKEALRRSDYQRIALDQHSIVSISDANGVITEINEKFCSISGYSREELIGQNHRIINSGYHPASFFDEMWQTISQGKVWHGLLRNRKKTGEFYWVDSTIVPFLDEQGIPYQYVSVRTDVTFIKDAEVQLQQAKELAENANQAKSRFLARMSHELRTPLNAILGYAQLMTGNDNQEFEEAQIQSAAEIEKAGWHLLRLIDDILELPKIEAGVVKLNIEPLHLMPVLMECENLIKPALLELSLTLQMELDACKEILVEADYTRLTQVILNLLSNACKYNKPNGEVRFSCTQIDNDQIRISVEDTGIGIAEKYHAEMFSSFNRLGAEESGISGTGVGLNITHQLVELMGGKVDFTSVVDEGSCFWIDLPTASL